MKLLLRKFCWCEYDECDGVLLVDVESEQQPRLDEHGNYQYYCPKGQHIFSAEPQSGTKRELQEVLHIV